MKVPKKHFDLFKKECQRWIKKLGINDYRIEFFIDYQDENNRCYIQRNLRGATIDVYFCANSTLSTDLEKCKRTAKHEMIHILLARLKELGEYK